MVPSTQARERIAHLTPQLKQDFPSMPGEHVEAVVESTLQRLAAHARFDHFLPLLTIRYAREALLEATGRRFVTTPHPDRHPSNAIAGVASAAMRAGTQMKEDVFAAFLRMTPDDVLMRAARERPHSGASWSALARVLDRTGSECVGDLGPAVVAAWAAQIPDVRGGRI